MARRKRKKRRNGERKVRMADVAARVGVSKAVVSAVLNPHGKSKIRYSEETRQDVLEAVDELGYRLNTTASNFLSGRHGALGLLVPSLGSVPSGVLSSMLKGSRLSGNMLMVEEAGLGRTDPPRMFVEDCVDGIILYGCINPWYREKAEDLGVPYVDVNSNERTGPCSITFAEEEGAALAARYFAEGGRRRPAFVRPENDSHFSVQVRAESFRRAALEHGMAEPVMVCSGSGNYWYNEARAFVREHPEVDCVLLYHTRLATVLYDEIDRADRSVPDDIAVIGTGSHNVAYTVRPSLTHLFLDHSALGRGAVRALREVVEGNPIPDELRCFPYDISVRYSTTKRDEE
jgi:DNA-binding LacI/PurR family transcriptional regulator